LHTYKNTNGCDSVVTAKVSIYHASTPTSINLRGDSAYTLPWGDIATASGYYSHLYQNIHGCDSLVTAYVVVNLPSNAQSLNAGINVNNPQRSLHVKDVIRLEPRNTAPNNPTKGDIYFDGTINKMRYYNGMQWIEW